MNDKIELCEVCGTKLITFIDNQCCGLKCPMCDKIKVVTTYNDPALYDENIYNLYLHKNEYSAKKAIALSKVLEINIIEASKMLVYNSVLAKSGKAIEIKKIITILKDNCMNFYINDFPYEV